MLHKLLYFIILTMLFASTKMYAQQIIDGSFENNTALNESQGNIDTNEFKLLKSIRNNRYPLPWYHKNEYQKNNNPNWLLFGNYNLKLAPHGTTFIIFSFGNIDDSTKLALSLTAPLVPNHTYTLRWASGQLMNSSAKKDSILIETGTNILYPTKRLYAYIPIDESGYRYYSVTFKADSAYTNIFFSKLPRLIGISYSGAIIDNVQLDTCVAVHALQNIGCASFPVLLSATNTGKQVLWNTGDTTPSIQVNQPGYYTAAVFDSLGCVSVDSMYVTASPITAPSSYTTKQICLGDSIQLTSKYNGTYSWNTGNTTQTIWVKDSGTYWVHTTVQVGCDATDTLRVEQQTPPLLGLANNTAFCQYDSVLLFAYNPYYTSYLWNTGSKDSVITINTSGLYKITASNRVCNVTDSIEATRIDLTSTKIDTSFCSGKNLQLIATVSQTYKWNTNDTTQILTINTPAIYWVNKTQKGCSAIDSFVVTEVEQPTASTKDTFYCATQSVELSTAQSQYYLWNTTEQTQAIKVNTKGMYWVTKTNQQCIGIDTFLVGEKQLPIITSLKDTTVCFAQVAQILLDAGTFKSYLWQPTGEITQTIYSTQAQVYLLTVTDSNNCSISKQIAVMETCPNFVYIPNAFTPNADGLNDVFLPKTRSLETYQMSIINQWGAIIFTTQNTNQGWDGKDAPAGVYIAIINYKATGKAAQTVSQNITLLR